MDPIYGKSCVDSQLEARDISADAHKVASKINRPYESLAPLWLGDSHLSSDEWASKAVVHFNTSFRKAGNHVCTKRVCYKGKWGRKGFCRMLYWHWRNVESKKHKDKMVWKRFRGRMLHKRWQPTSYNPESLLPPVEILPPQRGMAALETNHGFTCRFNPCFSLGPVCNNDVNVLLRLPILSEKLQEKMRKMLQQRDEDEDFTDEELKEFSNCCAEMHSAIVEHEFYCSAYASKEQPKLKELLGAMHTSLDSLDKAVEEQKRQGLKFSNMDLAVKVLHRLVSATNKCSHKGFPEIVSYLTKQPNFYSSHLFSNLHIFNIQNYAVALVEEFSDKKQGKEPANAAVHALRAIRSHADNNRSRIRRNLDDTDFMWRPDELAEVPLYFFVAMTQLDCKSSVLQWHLERSSDGSYSCHPLASICMSKHIKGKVLMNDETGEPLVHAPFFCHVRDAEPWYVPVVYGHRPHTPDAHSTPRDRGLYGLWMLLLFYPWRNVQRDLLEFCWQKFLTDTQPDPWEAIYLFFEKWLQTINEISVNVKAHYAVGGSVPEWTSKRFWATKCAPVIHSMSVTLARKNNREAFAPSYWNKPSFLEPPDENHDVESSAKSTSSDVSETKAALKELADNVGDDLVVGEPPLELTSQRCGILPCDDKSLRDILCCQEKFTGRSKEALYCRLSYELWSNCGNSALHHYGKVVAKAVTKLDPEFLIGELYY